MKRKSRSRSPPRSPFSIDWPRTRPTPFSAPPPPPAPPSQHPLYPVYHPPASTILPPPPPRPVPLDPVHPPARLPYNALPSQEDRIRRNVACTRCRDSKVRCLTSPNIGEPCQRCVKLGIPEECRFDKGHKRRTKANKLELLERELNTIKQQVETKQQAENKQQIETSGGPRSASLASTSPSTRTASTSGPVSSTSWPSPRPRLSPTKNYAPPVSASRHVPAQAASPPSEDLTPGAGSEKASKAATEPRVLGDLTVSGDDINFYFDKYMQFYHPLLPILRQRDPNPCYESHPTLFWTILYVSCRRFSRDEALYTALVEELSQTPWLLLSTASATLESIHALLIVCNWPLPTIRFLTDPCPSLLAVATVACMQLGLHLGKGTGEDYGCGERHNAKCTDEEAASTWLACCMLATKAATAAGIPPPSIQYDDQGCRKSLKNSAWDELVAFYDLQKWLNRFHAAMAAQVTGGQVITASIVSFWEVEFDAVRPSLVRIDTDLIKTAILSARLEIKAYYLTNPTLPVPPYLASHIVSIFSTARTLLNLLSTLDSASNHLRHHPQWSFRALLDTASLIIFCLHQRTACCPEISDTEATELAREAWSAVARCSVRHGDIPQKVSSFMETFWRIRERVPRGELPVGSWRNRLAVGVTFWCLKIMKIALVDAKILPDDTKIGTEHTKGAKSSTASETPAPETPKEKGVDDLLGVDWSFLFEDIGWSTSDLGYTEPRTFKAT